jgi:hypothetical protein
VANTTVNRHEAAISAFSSLSDPYSPQFNHLSKHADNSRWLNGEANGHQTAETENSTSCLLNVTSVRLQQQLQTSVIQKSLIKEYSVNDDDYNNEKVSGSDLQRHLDHEEAISITTTTTTSWPSPPLLQPISSNDYSEKKYEDEMEIDAGLAINGPSTADINNNEETKAPCPPSPQPTQIFGGLIKRLKKQKKHFNHHHHHHHHTLIEEREEDELDTSRLLSSSPSCVNSSPSEKRKKKKTNLSEKSPNLVLYTPTMPSPSPSDNDQNKTG